VGIEGPGPEVELGISDKWAKYQNHTGRKGVDMRREAHQAFMLDPGRGSYDR